MVFYGWQQSLVGRGGADLDVVGMLCQHIELRHAGDMDDALGNIAVMADPDAEIGAASQQPGVRVRSAQLQQLGQRMRRMQDAGTVEGPRGGVDRGRFYGLPWL